MRSTNLSDRIGVTTTAFRLILSPEYGRYRPTTDVAFRFRKLAESVTLRGDGSALDTVALCLCDHHCQGLGLHFLRPAQAFGCGSPHRLSRQALLHYPQRL